MKNGASNILRIERRERAGREMHNIGLKFPGMGWMDGWVGDAKGGSKVAIVVRRRDKSGHVQCGFGSVWHRGEGVGEWNDTNGVSNILGIGRTGDRAVSRFLGIRGGMHNRVSNTKIIRGGGGWYLQTSASAEKYIMSEESGDRGGGGGGALVSCIAVFVQP